MNDFDYDCLQKKKLAGQAKYRKRGSKSKKCTLPSDMLTQKQWEERCGPVVSFNFNKPMNWGAFKKLPATIQAEYITNLQNKYGATAVDLGNMFGVRALAVRKHADANNLGVSFHRGHSMNATQRAGWNEFLGATTGDTIENVSDNSVEGVPGAEAVGEAIGADVVVDQTEPTAIISPVEPKAMRMEKFSLQFSGAIDVNMISNSLRLILGDQSNGELEIICNLA